jgi:predicted outer membrane repeat protein
MQLNQKPCSCRPGPHLALIVCLILGIVGYAPDQVVLADPPPPFQGEEVVEGQPEWDVQLPTPTPPAAPGVGRDRERKAELRAGLAALEIALQQGPEAVLALRDTLRGKALDLAMSDIVAAHRQLARSAPPRPTTTPINEAEELAALQAQAALGAASRARALARHDDPAENQAQIPNIKSQVSSPNAPAADLTVGDGCDHATIGSAITAANPGDRLLLEGGRTFTENLTIPISLTLQGGYTGCVSGSSDPTTIDGGGSGSVVVINASLSVTLTNLNLTNGNFGGEGGGIRFALGSGGGLLTLNYVDIYTNTAVWGGGLWIGPNGQVVGTDVDIYNNTATTYGGGARLYGSSATFSDSNIYNNNAPSGAGVYGTLQASFVPQLNLPSYANIYSNDALTGNGLGGGVYMREGMISLADCSDLYSNDAIEGGGVYLVTSTLTIQGDCSEIMLNTATGNGGGVYAMGSTVNIDRDAELYDNTANTGDGGGAYLDNSNLWGDKALIYYNTADGHGGGVYATNGSLLDMDLGGYACAGPRCSQLSYNTANVYGGGAYATGNSEIDLRQVFVEDNSAEYGGGVYAYQSPVYLYNDLLARNDATSSIGDGLRLFTGASLNGAHDTLAHNDAGGATTGNAIGMSGATLTLQNSVIWGHTTSINDAAQTVTCSDIEGGYAGADNMNVNPLFVNPGSANFHLQSLSPVIDRCAAGQASDFDNEARPITYIRPATPYDMGADEAGARVGINGGGCAYGRIQDAVDAASNGDTLQAVADVFSETVGITQTLTIAGGYDSDCTTYITGTTTVNGGGAGSVFEITDGAVALRDLDITGGNGSTGGGVNVLSGNSRVTLDNTDVFGNQASYGGGVYVDVGNVLTITNDSDVHHNTAAVYGGGARVWGTFVGADTLSDIYNNSAPDGGGLAVPGGAAILDGSDMSGNQATGPTGRGGGIYVYGGGVVTLTGNVYIYNDNTAYDGAGICANDAALHLLGAVIRDNVAANDGGGVYLANGSALHASGAYIGYSSSGMGNEAVLGAGLYVDASTLDFGGHIINNIASGFGAGVYANASTINLTNAQVGGTGDYEANQLSNAGFGAGLYLSGTHASLVNTVVSSNTFPATSTISYGGGLYVCSGSVATLTNSMVERHYAPPASDGRGAGLYVWDSMVTLDNSQVVSNTAGTVGGGFRLYGTSMLNILNGSELGNNQTLNGEGGAIAATGLPTITISNSTLQGNTASTDGGAVYLGGGGVFTATNATFHDNQAAQHGGAIAAYTSKLTIDADYSACDPSVQCSAFYSNTADSDDNSTGDGGALYSNGSASSVDHTYLHRNSAYRGGAIYQAGASALGEVANSLIYSNTVGTALGAGIHRSDGAFTVTHVTLANNVGGSGFSGLASAAYNTIAWGNSTGGFTITPTITSCNIDESSYAGLALDPQFVAPGEGEDYHLQGSSPAIDACVTGLSPDLDNVARPVGAAYDMGAYEGLAEHFIYLPVVMRNH